MYSNCCSSANIHNMNPLFHLCIFFLCAEANSETGIESMNAALMRRFINPEKHSIEKLPLSMRFDSKRRQHKNVWLSYCEWEFVVCSPNNGIWIDVCTHSESSVRRQRALAVDWLPPSVQYVRIRSMFCYGDWRAERLPRDLRFLYMERFALCGNSGNATIDLSRLPRKMEELTIWYSWYSGEVVLENLPQTMRHMYLVHDSFKRVYVDARELPNGIEHLFIEQKRVDSIEFKRTPLVLLDPDFPIAEDITKVVDFNSIRENTFSMREPKNLQEMAENTPLSSRS